ncbi:MAG: CocE/NonD family hydrolase [Thermoleophilia bacterium]|nr:CocE/NonD family hydrolase [Thermoleophilia bacterium]
MGRNHFAASTAAFFLTALMVMGLDVSAADAGKKKGTAAPGATHPLEAKVRGSIGQIYIKDATPGSTLLLANPNGRIIRKGKTDSYGSKIFRELRPKFGYRVLQRDDQGVAGSREVRALKPGDNPKRSFYDKLPPLHEGLNYVTMRDGVKLAMTVRLPLGKSMSDGPFPTVIEHSGYGTAAPHDLLTDLIAGGGDPLAPDTATVVGAAMAPMLGYAVVSMQMRGSGCSGGAYDLFGLPTTYDGYDAVETVASQSWSRGDIGLVGISYSGISQLFMAGTRPPHLAAIAPMSVLDDIYDATGYPGGIFNSGFALSWVSARVRDAEPAPEGGQRWARELVNMGDAQCIENQTLRLQTLDVLDLIETNPNRTPLLFDQRAPGRWMKRINVPVFLTGQYQDEQTGGHFPRSLPSLDRNEDVWISMQNGVHTDSLSPSTMTQWIEFLDIFVGKEVPSVPDLFLGPDSLVGAFLGKADPIEQSDYVGLPGVDAAEAAFRRDNPRVRLLMDNGAGPGGPGAIGATWEMGFGTWPPRKVKATRFYLGKRGGLNSKKARRTTRVRYTADPGARPETSLPNGGVNDPQPDFEWAPVADGKGVGFVTGELSRDVVIAGSSSLDIYLKSSEPDTDLQVTLSEVRPDGKETYVQNGWLRASHRKLKPRGRSVLDPAPTHLKEDAMDLPGGRFAKVRIPIFSVSHAFRAGSRIRVTLQGTGGDRPEWKFDTVDQGDAHNVITLGGKRASSLALPVLRGVNAQGTPLPEPTALRAQPTRIYKAASNGG